MDQSSKASSRPESQSNCWFQARKLSSISQVIMQDGEQLLDPTNQQVQYFNYNPIYMERSNLSGSTQQQVTESFHDGGNLQEHPHQHQHQHQHQYQHQQQHHHHQEQLQAIEDEDDILKDVYLYSDLGEQTSTLGDIVAPKQVQLQQQGFLRPQPSGPASTELSYPAQQVQQYASRKSMHNGNMKPANQAPQQQQQQQAGNRQAQQQVASFQSFGGNQMRRVSRLGQPGHQSKLKPQRPPTEEQQQTNMISYSYNQHNHQHQQQHHHHQFTIGNGRPPANEVECNGLFVEYQTNRKNPLGSLEELHSLNVTNCDSETLEEQINMLTRDDCFESAEDASLTQFNMDQEEHDDHMLGEMVDFLNQQQLPDQNQVSQQQQQLFGSQQAFNLLEQVSGHNSCDQFASQQSANSQHQQQHHPSSRPAIVEQQRQRPAKVSAKTKKSCIGQTKKTDSASKKQVAASAKQQRTSGAKGPRAIQSKGAVFEVPASHQSKITTTNTNKRLLPANKNSKLTSCNNTITTTTITTTATTNNNNINKLSARPEPNSWKASGPIWSASPSSLSSNNSTCSSVMSPGASTTNLSNTTTSSSLVGQFENETPYKQQLENLKKKLNMNLAPATDSGHLHQQQPSSCQILAISEQQTGSQLVPTGPIICANSNSNQQQQPAFAARQLGMVTPAATYIITRPNHEVAFETAANSAGQLFLRTSTGALVALSSAEQDHRRPPTITADFVQHSGHHNQMAAPQGQMNTSTVQESGAITTTPNSTCTMQTMSKRCIRSESGLIQYQDSSLVSSAQSNLGPTTAEAAAPTNQESLDNELATTSYRESLVIHATSEDDQYQHLMDLGAAAAASEVQPQPQHHFDTTAGFRDTTNGLKLDQEASMGAGIDVSIL